MIINVPISYERISPAVLVFIVEPTIEGSICWYEDMDEEYFEFTIDCADDKVKDAEKLLSSFV